MACYNTVGKRYGNDYLGSQLFLIEKDRQEEHIFKLDYFEEVTTRYVGGKVVYRLKTKLPEPIDDAKTRIFFDGIESDVLMSDICLNRKEAIDFVNNITGEDSEKLATPIHSENIVVGELSL